jgi:hypothetical protein
VLSGYMLSARYTTPMSALVFSKYARMGKDIKSKTLNAKSGEIKTN